MEFGNRREEKKLKNNILGKRRRARELRKRSDYKKIEKKKVKKKSSRNNEKKSSKKKKIEIDQGRGEKRGMRGRERERMSHSILAKPFSNLTGFTVIIKVRERRV